MSEITDFYQNHYSTNELSQDELEALESISTYREYSKNAIIFSERQYSSTFFFLLQGKVKMVFDKQKQIDVKPGDVFGDWAMLSDTVRLATAIAVEKTKVLAVDSTLFKDSKFFPSEGALKMVLKLTKPIIGRLQSQSQTASKTLIEKGESDTVEFKSSLRRNLFSKQKDNAIEMAVVKTVAGFLNSKGGVLFVGVEDDGNIIGLEHDQFLNEDKILLYFGTLLHSKMGKAASTYVSETIVHFQDKIVLRVDCLPSDVPVFVNDKDMQYFYVRKGPQTLSFNLEETIKFVQTRFV